MTLLATIVVLGVLIFVHELGHFLAAKLVDIEVQRFSIGLGPRLWGVRKGETEYVLSWIPLGGYVKMGGMGDEVLERVEGGAKGEAREPGPRDFDGKPVWARTFVISAGVIMNMVFAVVAYMAIAALWGEPQLDTTRVGEVSAELLPAGTETLAGVTPGSRIVALGDLEVTHWGEVQRGLLEAPTGPLTLSLDDPPATARIRVPSGEDERRQLVRAVPFYWEPVAESVVPGSPADRGSLEAGDRVVAVEGEAVSTWPAFVRAIEARPGQRTELVILRDGREITRVVTLNSVQERDPVTGEEREVGKIGLSSTGPEVTYREVGMLEAVRLGWVETVDTTGLILAFLRDLFTGGVSPRSLGSIITIGQVSGQAAALGLDAFLRFMAFFSINLAILNLLPIPILDGGHLIFLAIEAVRGQALSVEQRLRWSQVGFIVILGIMLLALSNDFMRLFGL